MRARLNFRTRPILCITLYRNFTQASNFGGRFEQLFLWMFYEIFADASLLVLYHGAKVKNDQKFKSRGPAQRALRDAPKKSSRAGLASNPDKWRHKIKDTVTEERDTLGADEAKMYTSNCLIFRGRVGPNARLTAIMHLNARENRHAAGMSTHQHIFLICKLANLSPRVASVPVLEKITSPLSGPGTPEVYNA